MSRNKYTVARKSIWYVMRTLLIIMLVVFLAYAGLTVSMYISNMYILATEGMQLRAECIIQEASTAEMSAYFTEDFINSDTALTSGTYSDFTVNDFNYNLTIESIRVLPFASTGRIRVTERIPSLTGTYNDESAENPPELPQWTPVRCDIEFVRVDSRWYIGSLAVLEENPVEKPRGTPDLSLMQDTDTEQ